MGLELFRAAASVASTSGPDAKQPLRPDILRFSLLYRAPPDPGLQRSTLEKLFGAGGFDLFPLPSGDDPNVLILQFPGVARQQSPAYLFASADALVDQLDLAACIPDSDPGWLAEGVLAPTPPESVLGGVVWALCTTHGKAPADARWSIKAVRAKEAWARFGTKGEGIRIGQPDTGVAEHREIEKGIDIAAGTDILAGGGKPIDPLSEEMKSPGHGTATSSVAVSRTDGQISGVAPGATLVPIRCVNHVMLSSGAALAAAIDHARKQDCHVITMSLGGALEFQDLRRAIQRAVDAGMIVLAAAGNCVKFVVYPAWDANVIAVAATSSTDGAWKGTSVGSKIDIAAPGEDVYVARRKTATDPIHDLVEPGQGTSFAVATVAGVAALWLARHKPGSVRDEANRLGIPVQELFRAALRQTARTPAGWSTGWMGAGIADAEALLALELSDIERPASPVESAHPAGPVVGNGFNWTRFGAEAGYLALDRNLRKTPDRAVVLESPVPLRPSPGLAEALDRQGFVDAGRPAAPRLISLSQPDLTPGAALRLVARRDAGGAEASGLITEGSARSYLEGGGRQALLDAFENIDKALENDHQHDGRPADDGASALRARVRALAPEVLDSFISGKARSTGDFTGEQRFAAEALVKLTGRPALRLVDGRVRFNDPQLGDWTNALSISHRLLTPLVDAVCRVDVESGGRWTHAGTGTLVAPGVIMTNRHVLDVFAEQLPCATGRRFVMRANASVTFDEEARKPSKRFRVTEIIAAGPERIGRFADPTKLDIAFLAVESTNAEGFALPKVASTNGMPDPALATPTVAVVGYPAEPGADAIVDPATQSASQAIEDALWRIYQGTYGVKYISPGEVMPAALPGDVRRWGFAHDATTLGGNSGSALLTLGASSHICGLHFAGAPLTLNMAHALDSVRNAADADPQLLAHPWPIPRT